MTTNTLPVAKPKRAKMPAIALTSGVFARRIGLALLLGIAGALSFAPTGWAWLLPLVLVGLFRLLDGVSVRQANYLGLAWGVTFFGVGLSWLWGMFGAAALSLWVLCGAFPSLFCALYVGLHRRLPRCPDWLLAGVIWTAIEYFRSEPMQPNFAWLGLGYALVNTPWLAAPAALIGSYGLTFALIAFACLLARVPPRMGVALFAVWLGLCLLPRPVARFDKPLTVRLVQANSEDDESLFRLSQEPAAPGVTPSILIWPEYSWVSDPTRDRKLWAKVTALPVATNRYLLFGAKKVSNPSDERAFCNTAWLLAPSGQIVGTHVKNHTVHFINDGVAGRDANTFPTTFGRPGVAICFDLDYPDVARRLTANGADVLLAPSDNPAEWGDREHVQHKQMFQMRAIECGRWLATTDVAGNTFTVAPTGKIVQTVATAEPTRLDVTIDRRTALTPFVRGGWRFGEICLLGLGGCVVFALVGLFAKPHDVIGREQGGLVS